MVALLNAFQWIAEHTAGCSVDVNSDSLSALQYFVNNYYKATGSHVKDILVESHVTQDHIDAVHEILPEKVLTGRRHRLIESVDI